jgi:hypothetical protein
MLGDDRPSLGKLMQKLVSLSSSAGIIKPSHMDAKIIVYGICLVLIVAGASLWSYTMGIDDAEKELALARQQLAATQDGVRPGFMHARRLWR